MILTILAVHHTRKKDSDDAFNMISGTTGILGCADGALVLQKENRSSKKASLTVTGRDAKDMVLELEFDSASSVWQLIDAENSKPEFRYDPLLQQISEFVHSSGKWSGTATELASALGTDIAANVLTRRLNNAYDCLDKQYGFHCSFRRNEKGRTLILTHDDDNT